MRRGDLTGFGGIGLEGLFRDGSERNYYHQTNFSMKYGLAEGQEDVN